MAEAPERHASLLFRLGAARYAVPVKRVHEALWLPELTPIPQMPEDVAGVFNLRGRLVSVIDLSRRLGAPGEPYRLKDQIIVLNSERGLVGLIVNEILEVRDLSQAELSDAPEFAPAGAGGARPRFVQRVARLGEQLVAVLDDESLLDYGASLEPALRAFEADRAPLEAGPETEREELRETRLVFAPRASAEERRVFQERAASLVSGQSRALAAERMSIGVFSLGREYFGAPLHLVQEFTDLKNPTLVPCTPDHVAGLMNLRGEILTVIDLRRFLGLPASARTRGDKVIVVRERELYAGVLADELHDIIEVRLADLLDPPPAPPGAGGYVQGAFASGDRLISILRLSELLQDERLLVQEEV